MYGQSQGMNLPTSDFAWDPNPQRFMDPKIWDTLTEDDSVGYYLDVDMSYPSHLHTKIAHR